MAGSHQHVVVRSPREQELAGHMLPPAVVDHSRTLRCPMPGQVSHGDATGRNWAAFSLLYPLRTYFSMCHSVPKSQSLDNMELSLLVWRGRWVLQGELKSRERHGRAWEKAFRWVCRALTAGKHLVAIYLLLVAVCMPFHGSSTARCSSHSHTRDSTRFDWSRVEGTTPVPKDLFDTAAVGS